MRQERVPFAVVVDGHGGVSGTVAIEDLLEEVLGDVVDERPNQPDDEAITLEPDGSALVSGRTPVRDIERAFNVHLPDGQWTTVAGLCLALAERVPRRGEQVTTYNGIALEIVDATPQRIQSVRVRPPMAAASA
jgi:putative hemolysin